MTAKTRTTRARKPRMHLLDAERSGIHPVGYCGHMGTCTTRTTKVTCKQCLRALAAVTVRLAEAADAARRAVPPAVLSGPGQSDVGHIGARAIASSIAGEPVHAGYPWSTAEAAVRAHFVAGDTPRSVASSSSPERFGKRGGDSSGVVPTTPREMHNNIADVGKAIDRGCQSMEVGDRYLPRLTVREIVEARVGGRPVAKQVGPRAHEEDAATQARRGTYRERVDVQAEDIGEHFGLTRHQVGIVVRRSMQAIARILAAKGLIPPRAAAGRHRGEEPESEERMEWDLEGWKDIAPIVRRSEDVCQRLSKREKDPLPVTRYLGRVVAKRVEVEEWTRRQVATEAA